MRGAAVEALRLLQATKTRRKGKGLGQGSASSLLLLRTVCKHESLSLAGDGCLVPILWVSLQTLEVTVNRNSLHIKVDRCYEPDDIIIQDDVNKSKGKLKDN